MKKHNKRSKASQQTDTYTITRGVMPNLNTKIGRKPSRLGNTMRILNIGDGFVYPHTFNAATFNLRRAARTYGIELATQRTDDGVLAVRTA